MDTYINLIIFGTLFLVLLIVHSWQKKVDKKHHDRIKEEKAEAHERGTHKAISQYPQINPFLCIGCASCVVACPEDDVIGMINGIAQVVHGSRCVGHGLCEVVCPVGALKVGLGDIALRPDIPVLSEAGETTIPGIFIAGELGGLSLIRNAVVQGAKVVDAIYERSKTLPQKPHDVHDLLIVGAGPGGLTASLRAIEHNLVYVTIDQDDIGGTISKYPRRKLTLVQDLKIPLYGMLRGGEYEKEYLMEMWEDVVKKNQVNLHTKIKFQSVTKKPYGFDVTTSRGIIKTAAILLALGRRGTPRRLNVPGEESKKVLYQLIDAASYTNQKILVVGGGDSAIETATALANQPGNQVTLSYRQKYFTRLKKRNAERINEYINSKKVKVLFESNVTKIEDHQVSIKFNTASNDEIHVPNDFVFIFAGGEPPFELLKKIGIGFGGEQQNATNIAA